MQRVYLAALLAIVILATALRVYDLGDLPPGFFCDEAALGYNAYSILHTGRDENNQILPLYVWSFAVSYKNPVFVYAAMVPIAALGLSEQSVRLTSALFGLVAVLAIARLGHLVLGRAGALAAAFLLAVSPWHLHFSRIGFELISFPALFLLAFAALVRAVRGRPRSLLTAGLLFALCLYSYAPAKLFVPTFLAGAACIYARRLWAMRRWTATAVLILVLTGLPALIFDLRHDEAAGQYFSRTTFWNPGISVAENAGRLADNYVEFFSRGFLFERGDWIARHALPGFGELLVSTAPLMLAGVLWALWPGHPEGKLLLWWLALYPVAPALMNEIPSASRGIIGAPAFSLLAAAGLAALLAAPRRLLGDWRIAAGVQAAVAVLFVGTVSVEAWRYWRAYVREYPARAAEDFQYGYREMIRFMEERRGKYDLLLLTASNVNQPQIFTAFYNARPQRLHRPQDEGYLILDPAEYARYHMEQRVLAGVRPSDLYLFEDYEILHRVTMPSGKVEFVIIDAKSRRRFITEWLVVGPFENPHGNGLNIDYVRPQAPERSYAGSIGTAYWRRIRQPFVRVNLNVHYHPALLAANHQADWLCAYTLTQVESPTACEAALELGGPSVPARAWVNGMPVSKTSLLLASEPRRWPIQLQAGLNSLLLQVCKTGGDWFFTARVTDAGGRDLTGLRIFPTPLVAETPAAPAPPLEEPHA